MKKTVLTCDRCGKQFGLEEWPEVLFRGEFPTKIQMKAIIRTVGDDRDLLDLDDIDLCKTCRAEFRDWWGEAAPR